MPPLADGRIAPLASTLGVFLALAMAVFYHGPQVPLLAAAEAVLVVWLAASVIRRYADGLEFPLTPLAVSLTLFWCWLGLTLLWNPVPAIGAINFWWVGSIALAFWAYTLAPDRDRVWHWSARLALLGALALCAYALIQVTVWGQPPRATFVNIHSFAALLVLLSLPTAAYFLIALAKPAERFSVWGLGAALFVLWLTVAATQGRGTTISLFLGLATLVLASARHAPRRHLLLVIALCGFAYGSANLALQGALSDRFATLADPAGAAFPRLLIWSGSWEMVKDHPWVGIGLGNYYLAWPRYRDPADATLGFFAHNDYLQIWIEAGLPALLLLLAVLVCVLYMTVRMLRHARPTPMRRIEVAGLFSGLLAVAAHSFLDFNLYILPISIAAGLILGRWHEQVTQDSPVSVARVWLRRYLQPSVHRLVVVMVALLPLLYFVALAGSEVLYQRALRFAAEGKLQDADRHLAWAESLIPSSDRFYIAHADLFRFVLSRTPHHEMDSRVAVYNDALELLGLAEAENPYRALVHDIRGRLIQEGGSHIAGSDWRDQAEREYQRALSLNPRLIRTRLVYASLLLSAGDSRRALALLEDGARHWYYPDPTLIAYYDLLARLLDDAGRTAEADQFAARRNEAQLAIARLASARPVVQEADIRPQTTGSNP